MHFSTVTQSIGSVDSTVNLALRFISPQFLLVGIFIIAAFISTAIGTSMGTIATIAPIAAGLVAEGVFPASLGLATVVGGAMFGDNLSLISDTTIAAVLSQEAEMRAKLKINALVAILASIITIAILFFAHEGTAYVVVKDYSLLLVSPYLLLIFLAVMGVPVFVVLISSLTFAGTLGFFASDYGCFQFSQDIAKGFTSVYDIVLLSLLVGGLSGLAGNASKDLAHTLSAWISKTGGVRMAQLVIAKIVSGFDILLANNTVAIIFSGEMARVIDKDHHIPPHYSAAWLSIFSCVFQGLIPYGAQLLLAASIGGVSPVSLVPHVYYCYILGIVAVAWILLQGPFKATTRCADRLP